MPSLQRLDQTAASRNKRRQFEVLLTVTAPHERLVFFAIAGLVAATLAWGIFGQVTPRITTHGVIVTTGERFDLVATRPGYLIEYHVAPGDSVDAGTLIARQSVPGLDHEIHALLNQLNRSAKDGIGSVTDFEQAVQTAFEAIEVRHTAQQSITTHIAGEVMALNTVPGEFVSAGSPIAHIRISAPDQSDGQLQAVLRASDQIASRITIGTSVVLEMEVPGGGGDVQTIPGQVVAIGLGPWPEWLAKHLPGNGDAVYRVDIALETPGWSAPDGTPCRVHLSLGKGSPARLLTNALL